MTERNAALEARLKTHLRGCCFGGALQAFTVCDSTMECAHALAETGAAEGMLVFAERQTRGRGRLGRAWESPAGGVYFSLILRPSRPLAEAPQLSLVAGLAAAEAVRELTQLSPAIRWPNDVLLDGKKVAGILTEASTQHTAHPGPPDSPRAGAGSTQSYVIVGIGINVTTDPHELPDTATSLAACGAACDPDRLVARLCSVFDGWYDRWTAHGFAPIRAALRPWLTLGGIVRIQQHTAHSTQHTETEGQTLDVDEAGRLLVRLDSGIIRAFDAGEVTLLR